MVEDKEILENRLSFLKFVKRMREKHRGEDKLRDFFKWVRHSLLIYTLKKEASREGNDEDKKNQG